MWPRQSPHLGAGCSTSSSFFHRCVLVREVAPRCTIGRAPFTTERISGAAPSPTRGKETIDGVRMKIARFNNDRIGVVRGDSIVDVTDAADAQAGAWPPVAMNRLIANFAQYRPKLERA